MGYNLCVKILKVIIMRQEHHIFPGMLAMVFSAICVSLTCFLGKALSESLSLSLLVFIRFFCPLLITAWALFTLLQSDIKWQWTWLHVLRAAFAVLGQYCLFYTLSFHSVLMATLLFSTGPLFVPLVGFIVHRSSLDRKMLMCIMLGFFGVVCVLHPGLNGTLNWGLLLGLGAGLFNACSQVTFHKISQQQEPLQASLFLFTFSTLFALIPMLVSWFQHHVDHEFAYMLDSDLLLILFLFSICSMSNQMFRAKAYRWVSRPAYLAPFAYLSIPLTALLDCMAGRAIPDYWLIAGCFFIISSGCLMVYYRYRIAGEGLSAPAVVDPNTGLMSILKRRSVSHS